jgi:hypothetical protein
VPGTYHVRLTKNGQVYERRLEVGLDRRATFTVEDRRAQYAAAMVGHALFGRMSALVDRLNGLKALAAERRAALPAGAPAASSLDAFTGQIDALRKLVVATKEGGAITGEERLREHLDYAYGALLSYEGRPGDYQTARVAVLERELAEVEGQAKDLEAKELPDVNEALKRAGAAPIASTEAVQVGEQLAALSALEAAHERAAVAVAARRAARD